MDDKELLTRFTMVAKKLVYDPKYAKQLLQLLGTKQGAITAVHSILAIIQKQRPIPPQIYARLAVNIYVVMVDLAKDVFKTPPDKNVVAGVVAQLKQETSPQQEQAPQPQQQAPQTGIIAQQMGAPA